MAIKTFDQLIGKTMFEVVADDPLSDGKNTRLNFKSECGHSYTFTHPQDCCETVYIEDIIGDLNDLVGSPIIEAEQTSKENAEDGIAEWTFYRFSTAKGTITVRWYGWAGGPYSLEVNFYEDY